MNGLSKAFLASVAYSQTNETKCKPARLPAQPLLTGGAGAGAGAGQRSAADWYEAPGADPKGVCGWTQCQEA